MTNKIDTSLDLIKYIFVIFQKWIQKWLYDPFLSGYYYEIPSIGAIRLNTQVS